MSVIRVYEPDKGTQFYQQATMALTMSCAGMVFNDVFVRITKDSTPETMWTEYGKKLYGPRWGEKEE